MNMVSSRNIPSIAVLPHSLAMTSFCDDETQALRSATLLQDFGTVVVSSFNDCYHERQGVLAKQNQTLQIMKIE
jgi:hypothetical protein